jgi:hypothetical protein
MKTRTNIESFRKTKVLKSKKPKIQKKTQKQDKIQKQNKHSYYIVQCNNALDTTILSKYLKMLGIIPDSKGMQYVEKQYKLLAAKKKLSKQQFCDSYDKKLLVKIPPGQVTADIFFYHINSTLLDKPFYRYNTFLSNVINVDYSYIDKGVLYTNILKYNSGSKKKLKYFIETFMLSNKDKFKFPGDYILRPIYGFDGSGILYVHNYKDLINVIKYYDTHNDYRNQPYSHQEITVSKFITDLLLFKGRKCHLRIYYMVAILEGELSCFILDIGNVRLAAKPYNLDMPYTKDVHDTHSTDADYFFPYDFTLKNISSLRKGNYSENEFDTNTILKGIREIGKGIGNIFGGLCKGNPESLLFQNQQNGYHIYGLDILVRDNLEPVLVECNNQPGLTSIIDNKELSEIVYGWINETILEPLFKHPGHATEFARKHRTYIALNNS